MLGGWGGGGLLRLVERIKLALLVRLTHDAHAWPARKQAEPPLPTPLILTADMLRQVGQVCCTHADKTHMCGLCELLQMPQTCTMAAYGLWCWSSPLRSDPSGQHQLVVRRYGCGKGGITRLGFPHHVSCLQAFPSHTQPMAEPRKMASSSSHGHAPPNPPKNGQLFGPQN